MDEKKEDAQRVMLAQTIKKALSNWAFEVEVIGIRAKICRARYLALRKEGFESGEALTLCLKAVEL